MDTADTVQRQDLLQKFQWRSGLHRCQSVIDLLIPESWKQIASGRRRDGKIGPDTAIEGHRGNEGDEKGKGEYRAGAEPPAGPRRSRRPDR